MTATGRQGVRYHRAMDPIAALDALLAWLDAWAAATPERPLWPGGPRADAYAAGLTRPTGSYVAETQTLADVRALFARLAPIDVTGEVDPAARAPDHQVWRAALPDGYTAWEAAVPLSALDDAQLSAVRVARGPHGIELRAPTITALPTRTLTLITTAGRLVTWYPGAPGTPVDLACAMVKLAR